MLNIISLTDKLIIFMKLSQEISDFFISGNGLFINTTVKKFLA